MNWRAYALRFGFAHGLHGWIRSERGRTETKVFLIMVAGLSTAVTMFTVEAVWHLTGRARRVRHLLGYDQVVVIPGPRGLPPAFAKRLEEQRARMKADEG